MKGWLVLSLIQFGVIIALSYLVFKWNRLGKEMVAEIQRLREKSRRRFYDDSSVI